MVPGKYKHGTGQYRLNNAKEIAASILQNVNRIENVWQLSKGEYLDEEDADVMIRDLIDETEQSWESLSGNLKYREELNN